MNNKIPDSEEYLNNPNQTLKKKKSCQKSNLLMESMDSVFAKNKQFEKNAYDDHAPSKIEILDDLNNHPRVFTETQIKKQSQPKNKSILSESFFTERCLKIEQMRSEISKINIKATEEELRQLHEKKITISNSTIKWEYTTFTTDINSKDEIPIINNQKWSYAENLGSPLEIRNLIFRSDYEFEYSLCHCEINCEFILQGQSSFWLFLHTLYNINNDETAVIQISKEEENSQKVFISLGVFLNKNDFKILARQQLINFNNKSLNNKVFIENDRSNVRLVLQDPGDNAIKFKAYLNNCLFENSISSDIFLPIIKKAKIFLAGSGHRCTIKEFSSISFVKPEIMQKFGFKNDRNQNAALNNDCSCCSIF